MAMGATAGTNWKITYEGIPAPAVLLEKPASNSNTVDDCQIVSADDFRECLSRSPQNQDKQLNLNLPTEATQQQQQQQQPQPQQAFNLDETEEVCLDQPEEVWLLDDADNCAAPQDYPNQEDVSADRPREVPNNNGLINGDNDVVGLCPKCSIYGVTFPTVEAARAHIQMQHSFSHNPWIWFW